MVWDRRSGRPRHRAIVWQDRRTAPRCDELAAAGHLDLVRGQTGLILDPYFSGTKLEWLLTEGHVAATPDLAFGTVDSWIIWQLTAGSVHVTDASNASRTLLYDIRRMAWSDELLGSVRHSPDRACPRSGPSSGPHRRDRPRSTSSRPARGHPGLRRGG